MSCRAGHGRFRARAQRFKNLSGGIVMVISRGFGSNKVASENMAP
jgi:hypothetical protein